MPDAILIRRAKPMLGTIVEIAVDPDSAERIDAAFSAVAHIHRKMSFHDAGSDLHLLRTLVAGDECAVDPHTMTVLRIAAQLYRLSGGLFDITTGLALVRDGFLPDAGISNLDRYTGTADDIEILADNRVRLRQPVLMDLGGIAKGYAVDQAVAALLLAGAQYGIVNAGGDLRVFGAHTADVQIRGAGLASPESIRLRDCAIASSENVHSRYKRGGQTLAPHIDRSGAPVFINETVSVVASTCVIADGLTKVAAIDPSLAGRLALPYDGFVVGASIEEVGS